MNKDKENNLLIYIDDSALRQLQNVNATGYSGKSLRIRVDTGGCAGFQYLFSIDNNSSYDEDEDIKIERDGVFILVDKVSVKLLKNSTLSYEESLGFSEFVIRNLQSSSRCGCGSSFSV